MAHDPGPSPRGQRLFALGAVCALAAATAVAFGRVFSGGHAVAELVVVAVISALLAGLLERRNLVVATMISAAGLLVVVGVLIFPKTTFYGLPTLDTLRAIRDAAADIGRQADAQVAPTPPLEPLFLAATTALWAAVFSAHALAIRAGSPLLALLPPVALVAFADTVLEETERPLYGVLFLAAALLVVFVDGLRRVQRWGPSWVWPGDRGRLSSATGKGARRVAALALSVATLLPIALPGFGTSAVIDLSSSTGGDTIRVSPLVSIQSALQETTPVELFQVRSQVGSYWRTLALDTFNGVTWERSEDAPTETVASAVTPLATRLPEAELLNQTVIVGDRNADTGGVPLAFPATRVDYPGDLAFDRDLGALLPEDGTIPAGTQYDVQSFPVVPTQQELEDVVFPEAPQDSRYLAIPDTLSSHIRGTAIDWIREAGAVTAYDQILAIQNHLHDTFHYDPNVPPRDDSFTLDQFVNGTKRGFCQQFASAMAVMLRTIGIPARVAVGFTQGTRDPNDNSLWHIDTNDAHAWVEVDFPTYGWLTFEPTPTRINPIAVAYDDPASGCPTNGTPCTANGVTGSKAGKPNASGGIHNAAVKGGVEPLPPLPVPGQGVAVPVNRSSFPTGPVFGALGALLLLALLVIPPARSIRRRLRLRRAGNGPRELILATYRDFDDRASDLGWGRRPGETLQEYRRRLRAVGTVDGEDLGRLTALAGLAAYAEGDPAPDAVDEATRAAGATLRAMRRGAGLSRRVLGMYRLGAVAET